MEVPTALAVHALVALAHLGFQATVTVLVYPALARLAAPGAQSCAAQWSEAHRRHSRAIAPLVAVLYPALVASGAWLALTGPGGAGWVALLGAAVAVGATAVAAAPTHGRIGREGPTPALVRRLLRADRARLAGAALGAAGAVLAVLG
ncbi:hypothetical protein I601_3980 [Nocardioides dokdonensis FR1436]|uniref:DUF1772 domain-containing protein n=1 Tax=Nocardioides dokdonensis FR1436 TaxID=1300347 RepID=A0A1A9GPW1_9ACTN|nr:hypothetical protein [Nocardioides dokdonensis]ANH40377.1 hypothetical protein I601_3980 [Nocardioides dokdonensis FR1436]